MIRRRDRFKTAVDQELRLREPGRLRTVSGVDRPAQRRSQPAARNSASAQLPFDELDHTHRIRARVSRDSTIWVPALFGRQPADRRTWIARYGTAGSLVRRKVRRRCRGASGKHARLRWSPARYRIKTCFPLLLDLRLARDHDRPEILEMAAMDSEERVHEALRHSKITVEAVREHIDADTPAPSPWQVRIADPTL